jgi:hypothetical protein
VICERFIILMEFGLKSSEYALVWNVCEVKNFDSNYFHKS